MFFFVGCGVFFNLYCNIIAIGDFMKNVTDKPMELRMMGFEVVEKMAKPCATSARVLVPKHWVGKRVKVVRLE